MTELTHLHNNAQVEYVYKKRGERKWEKQQENNKENRECRRQIIITAHE